MNLKIRIALFHLPSQSLLKTAIFYIRINKFIGIKRTIYTNINHTSKSNEILISVLLKF